MITKEYLSKIEDIELYGKVLKEYMTKYLKEHVGYLPSQSTIDERDEMIYQEYLKRLAEKKNQSEF